MAQNNGRGILLEAGTNEVEFLVFACAKQNYGINVSKVCQIIQYSASQITKLPEAPPECIGAVYFRGHPIAVYDLRVTLSLPQEDRSPIPLLLVTEFNSATIAFLIDEVFGIERMTWKDFSPLEDSVFSEETSSVLGTFTTNQQLVMILDLEAMMARLDPTMRLSVYEEKIAKDTSGYRKNLKILYCEDSLIVQKMLIKTLSSAGFEKLTIFSSGKEGLDHLKEVKPGEFDLIISDIEMPEMDGLTLCKSVRGINGWEATPFIVFSSLINSQMKEKCQAVGVNAAFSKPEIQNIVNEIDRIFG